MQENAIAYAFMSPALLLIFIFGIYPLGFAFFVSLHRWRRFPGEYVGLSNYVRALDSFAYVLFFWLAVGALIYGVIVLRRMLRQPASERAAALSALVPGAAASALILALVNWIAILIPIILDIPQRLRGQERVPGLFVGELAASFRFPEAASAGAVVLLAGAIALGLALGWQRLVQSPLRGTFLLWGVSVTLAAAAGLLILQTTVTEIQAAIASEGLPIWSQIIFISAGAALVFAAYRVWQAALKQDGNRRFSVMAIASALLVVGGYILAVELPQALANADPNVLSGFGITVMFALGTVPFQLAIGYRSRLIERFKWVDTQLEGRDYLMGSQFTVADAYLFTVAGWGKYVGVDIGGLKHLGAYLGRVAARPAVQEALKAEGLLK